jgi:glycerol kinase
MSILVIDVGTSGVRAAMVDGSARITHERYAETLPDIPAPGLVEFDAARYADVALGLAREVLAEAGHADAVGISTQRASAVVWDRATGEPVAPAQSWQDLRTLGHCLMLGASGYRVAPNHAATKYADIWNAVDPERNRDLCVGTVDSWLVWRLTDGAHHVTDATNASVSGLADDEVIGWNSDLVAELALPPGSLPRIVDTSGYIGDATALAGSPPITGLAGDQQASLTGQGCVGPGSAKITFGTGGMLDLCLGPQRTVTDVRAAAGTFPLICRRRGGDTMWGLEAIMLSAGTNVQWLRDDLGIIDSAAHSEVVAAGCESTDGVMYVPAQLGLGTPHWDYGARGALVGLTRGSGRPEVVRAVLEGVAHRGLDLIEAAESDAGIEIPTVRVDGGMSENAVFTRALADISGRVVEVAPQKDATTVGAALLAGVETGLWADWEEVGSTWAPREVIEPADIDREGARAQWKKAIAASTGWFGELSAIDF